MDLIVNNDDLAINCAVADLTPVPAPSTTDSPPPGGKENIYEGDLGLGGYELRSEPALGQSQLVSSAWSPVKMHLASNAKEAKPCLLCRGREKLKNVLRVWMEKKQNLAGSIPRAWRNENLLPSLCIIQLHLIFLTVAIFNNRIEGTGCLILGHCTCSPSLLSCVIIPFPISLMHKGLWMWFF